MMKRKITFLMMGTLLVGCNPFESQQDAIGEFIQGVDDKARQLATQKEKDIVLREIKPYTNYTYQSELADPFRVRDFIIDEDETNSEDIVVERENPQRCLPPECRPPAPHPKSILEEFTLESLNYVGTFENNGKVALIGTPTYGVVNAKIGDYLGLDNGRIIEIKESALIIQEKIRKNGLWKDKKSVLRIRR